MSEMSTEAKDIPSHETQVLYEVGFRNGDRLVVESDRASNKT